MGYGVDRTPVKVTPGEAILPVKTTKALGVGNIRNLIRQTTGKSPKIGVRSGGKYATGETPDDPAYNAGTAVNQAVGAAGHAIANAGGDYIAQTVADTGALAKPVMQFARGAFGMPNPNTSDTATQAASKNINPVQQSPITSPEVPYSMQGGVTPLTPEITTLAPVTKLWALLTVTWVKPP